MTKPALPAALLVALTSGCIVYDDKCPNTGFDGDDHWSWDDTGGEEVVQPQFWLTPAEGAPGETLILSLQADQEIDFAGIEDLTFTGGLTLCTTQAREDEHWLERWRRSGELTRGTRTELAGCPCRHLIVRSPKGQRCDVFVVPGPIRWLVFVGDRAGRPPSETGILGGLEHLPK